MHLIFISIADHLSRQRPQTPDRAGQCISDARKGWGRQAVGRLIGGVWTGRWRAKEDSCLHILQDARFFLQLLCAHTCMEG
jgi:hypothetical protein